MRTSAQIYDRRGAGIGAVLDAAQSVDQAGFRKGFCCEDHLFGISLILEKTREFRQEVWAAAVDFTKAFDTIEHCEMWKAMERMRVPGAYIRILSTLYVGQEGMVSTDKRSKHFKILRGTKQGDPLSPCIFNAVLEVALSEVQTRWRKEGFGIQVGQDEVDRSLCNLRFADDVLLLAGSRDQLESMLKDVANATRAVGLELHMGKTKILNNIPDDERHGSKVMHILGKDVEILEEKATTMYLGRSLSFGENTMDAELQYRINQGWAKFHMYKDELTNSKYPLKDRLRLFEAVITPSVLYGSGSWTMVRAREDKLRTAQRKMLRRIVKVGRRLVISEVASCSGSDVTGTTSTDNDESEPERVSETLLEDWVQWVIRATGLAEANARRYKVSDWVLKQKENKWHWAGHTSRRTDGRWSTALLEWTPDGTRKAGHPVRRWEDEVNQFVTQYLEMEPDSWRAMAEDRDTWRSWAPTYAREMACRVVA